MAAGTIPAPVSTETIAEMRQLQAEASVLGEAAAGNVNIGHGQPSSKIPTTVGPATFDEIAVEFSPITTAPGTWTEQDAQARLSWARDTVHLITHGPPREPETLEQRNFRIITDYEGLSAREAGYKEGLSESRIRQVREEHGRDPSRGKEQA